ncbi:hypothetical protein H7K20_00780 [Priestia aryabhattai]|uniref:hypothetical protein n=1 Tax=Priestia aryabhattai TaxID=412384 RepID=UPI001C8ED748|nr:hypothetical protein [Priestia aryabhattai]MBY0025617.1 hypothetical protein [Priestia aryabhattai]
MRNNPKNFSVKIIKGNAYIYSWVYKKKKYRSNQMSQRYYWKYRGRYGTQRIQDFTRRLSREEKKQLKEEVKRKLKIYQEIQKKVEGLLEEEPFKTRYNEVISISNRIVREAKLNQLYRELNRIIKDNQNETY